MDEKVIRETSHDTPKLFFSMIETLPLKWFENIVNNEIDKNKDLSNSLKIAKEAVNHGQEELALLDADNIQSLLDLIPKIEEKMQILFKLIHFNVLEDFIVGYLRLYLLSCLSFAHESFTRYPDKQIKPSHYTQKLGIVEKIPAVQQQTEIAITQVQKLLNLTYGANDDPC